MDTNPALSVDCVGLFCPQPLFQTRQALDKLKPGEILELLADDPAAEEDIKAFCRKTGNELLKIEKEGSILKFYIRKI
ncbi:MAG: sulfurtransferase TusA family protein [candidate division WOR-3 bacterium]|nr:sulfurtransferase TusA family protein [candidate division WOR-3 bacterium]